MTDEPTIQVGEIPTRVTDPHAILPVSCDIIVEHRVLDGMLFLTLGSHLFDGTGPAEVRVVARLRMKLQMAESIYNTALRTLEEQRQAATEAKKTAN
jgi:hypothetical protein